MDPTYPLFPIFAFLGFVLSLIPLPWHLQAWNSGTCAFMIWTASLCLVEFVNSIIWHGNMDNVAPVWCDISTQIMLAAGIGMPASILCISRRLFKITSIQTVSVTRADKRKAIIIDMCIAVGIPLLVLILHIPVHAHRFDILEDIGCYPVTYGTLASYFLYYVWPIALGAVSFVYSGLTLRSFFIRRAQFSSLLSSNSLNMNRYIRLMMLSISDMSFTVPFSIYIMYIGTHGIELAPWISWAETHYHWNRVEVVPASLWRGIPGYQITVELTRWLAVFCALVFFALFGFASEAKKNYKKMFWAMSSRLGFKRASAAAPTKPAMPSWCKPRRTDSQATLPVYTVSPSKGKDPSFSGEVMELGVYSPGPEKPNFSTYSPSTTSFNDASSISNYPCTPSTACEHIDISEGRFDVNFKPLPPLPEPTFPTSFSPYLPLRHATSMPLPTTVHEYPLPLYHPSSRDRQGSLTVVVEKSRRVDAR